MADLPSVSAGDAHPAAHNAERTAINANTNALATKISTPSSPQTGQIIRYDGTIWTKSTTRYFEGTGTPEGVVSAPIGSQFARIDGANGAIIYVKASGTGTTGWILLQGDTGWRNVLASVDAGAAGAAKYAANLRRINNLVQLYLDIETPNANGNWGPYTLPSGFRPVFNMNGILQDNKGSASTTNVINSDGTLTMTTIGGSIRDRWNAMFFTDNNWPGSLPGSAL